VRLAARPDGAFSIFPSSGRSWVFAVLCFLLGIPGIMAWLVENEPGIGDDVLYVFLSVPWFLGGGYLLRRRRRPILRADGRGLVLFPYDDPVASLRYGSRVEVPWAAVASITARRVGSPAVFPVMLITTADGGRLELPLAIIGIGFDELSGRLQAAAGPIALPIER
jgi:hypothetical protein